MFPDLELFPSKPVHLYSVSLQDLGAVENLSRWIPIDGDDDEFEEQHFQDVTECIQTSTKLQIMYMGLMSVILDEGTSKSDRFIKNHRFLSVSELNDVTISGGNEKKHAFDSLGCLLNLAYKKISVIFKYQLSKLDTNFKVFWFFRSVFLAALTLLKQYAREEFSSIHTKSLLTMIVKQQNPNSLIRVVNQVRMGY